MKILASLIACICFPVLAQASESCGDPLTVAAKFMEAHLKHDAGALYELTAKSAKGDKGRFVANYVDENSTSSDYQKFWRDHFDFKFKSFDVSNGVAKVEVESTYPDSISVATRLVKEGDLTQLESPRDWDYLYEIMDSEGFSTVSRAGSMHLLCEEGGWRVLRPQVVD
ncbi:hypothetical protein QC589_01440 [Halomonas elongata]|uniref:hypothetical protein n=1 Tax=Halomonas elongata TaxID=2746 RepID=UPI00335666C6